MALLAEKTVSGCGLGCLRIESLKPARMLGSTAYGSKLPLSKLIIKSCLVRVSCNISSTSWIYEGIETLGCGIMMQLWMLPVMDVAGGDCPDLIVDDATLLIHLGVKAEEEFSNTGKLPDPETTTNLEFQMVLGLIKESIKVDPLRYHMMKKRLVGVSGETTTAVKRQMQDSGSLPFPAINVNGPFIRIKFDNLYGSRPSLPDGLMEATDFMMGGTVVRCGYGDVGKPFCAVQNLTEALPEGVYGDVGKLIMEARGGTVVRCGYGDVGKPFCAVQNLTEALPEGVYGDVGKPFCSVQNLTETLPEGVFHTADIFVTTTSNKYIIMVDHMRKMKNNAIVCNIGLGEGPLMNLGCAYTGHPSFVMSCSFTRRQRISTCPLRDLTILKRTDSCHKDEGPSLASSIVLFQC